VHIFNFDFSSELARRALALPVWLLENEFPYDATTLQILIKNKLIYHKRSKLKRKLLVIL
jgi:hypothetical protein